MAIIQVGDDLIDDETGEYAGPAESTLESVETEDDLVVFMRHLMVAESNLEARKRQLETVIENCRSLVRREERRVEWLRRRFEQSAAAVADELLPRKKDGTLATKKWSCPYGTYQRRTVPASVSVVDDEAAVEWCHENAPSAVKTTEKVLVGQVKDLLLSREDVPECFTIVPARESVTFSTLTKEKTDES